MRTQTRAERKGRIKTRERLAQLEASEKRGAELSQLPSHAPRMAPMRRSINAGLLDQISAHFQGTFVSMDEDLSRTWKRLVARSRELALNNPYMKRFLQLSSTAVVGQPGIRMQSRAEDASGNPDEALQKQIEDRFRDFERRENCDLRRKRNFRDMQEIFLRGVLRDGESLSRIVLGNVNSHGIALQPLDPMLLDPELNGKPPFISSSHQIVMGVELDENTLPVAYWIRQPHDSTGVVVHYGRYYRRLPASEVIHEFPMLDRADYNRGVPSGVASVLNLEMLGGSLEAELTASRVEASKMGAYTRDPGAPEKYEGEHADLTGRMVDQVSPGEILDLPPGMRLEMFDPKHPNSAFGDFTKLTLRGVSAGFGCGYNTLANDLEGVTYGSLRNAAVEDREYWRTLQDFTKTALCERVFDAWLKQQFLTGSIDAPPSAFDRLRKARWFPRGFPWIDPLKEQQAAASGILETHTLTRTEILAERGIDFDEHIELLRRERAALEKAGIPLEANGSVLNVPADPEDD